MQVVANIRIHKEGREEEEVDIKESINFEVI